MSWVVVQFLDEDKIEVAPTNWISSNNNHCFWPPPKEKADFHIRNCTDPDENVWDRFSIKVMCRKPFDKFITATAKASKACRQSDIESTSSEIDPPQKRRIRKPKCFDSESDLSSGIELEDSYTLPNPPKILINKKCVTLNSEKHNTIGKETAANYTVANNNTCKATDEHFQKEVITQLVKMSALLKNQKLTIESLERKIGFLVEKVEVLGVETKINDETLNEILDMLPLKNSEDFTIVEDFLANKRTVSNLLIFHETAKKQSFRGHKGKKDFSKTSLSKVILGSVIKGFKTTEREVELTIAVWLTKANVKVGSEKIIDGPLEQI